MPTREAESISQAGPGVDQGIGRGASYRSDAPEDVANRAALTTANAAAAAVEPYMVKFTMSQASRERIFELATKLDYFSGKYDYTKHRIASSGVKTLIYGDATRHNETTYNWSENPLIDELTKLFQNISQTLEFGRHLEHMARYDKLGVDGELRRMEEVAAHNELLELQAVEPVLRRIAGDSAMLHIARLRADKLLARLPGPGETKP